MTRCSMSKGALAGLTGDIAVVELLEMCSRVAAAGMGKGPSHQHMRLPHPVCRVRAFPQRTGPAESQAASSELGANGQEQTAVPGLLPLGINQCFSESQTWLCLRDINYEIQKLIQLRSFG